MSKFLDCFFRFESTGQFLSFSRISVSIEARKLKSKRRKMSEEKVKKAFKKAKKSFIKVLEREGFKPVRFELRGTLRGN